MIEKIDKVLSDERTCRAHIWITNLEFNVLLLTFVVVDQEDRAKRKLGKKRMYWGKPPKLTDAKQRLFFILNHMKTNPKYDVQGIQWWVDKSVITDWVVRYTPLLLESLTRLWTIPPQTVEEFEKRYKDSDFKLLRIDATEREIARPTKSKTQKKYYSGKKKNTH